MKYFLILNLYTLLILNYVKGCELNEWTDSTGKCQPCHHSCAECSDQAENHCTACLADKTLTDGFCKCNNENQYIDKEGTCSNCFASCKTCVGPLFSQCTSCDEGNGQTLMKQEWEINGTCECSDNTKFAVNGAACGNCDASCEKCLGAEADKCIKCPATKMKQPWGRDLPGYCIVPCGEKQFRDMSAADAANQICRTCSSQCSNCSGPSATECTGCIEGYLLKGIIGHPAECLQKCEQENTFRDATGGCTNCDPACGSCFGPTKEECYSCAIGYYQFFMQDKFICIQACEAGKYREMTDNSCQPCHDTCAECKGPNNGDCMKCKIGWHKTPYYEELGSCFEAENCEMKQYRNAEDFCVQCHDTCLHCKGPLPSDCMECDYQLAKMPPAKDLTGSCLMKCEDSMKYRNPEDGLCKQCDITCEECSGPGYENCLKCMDKTKVIYPQIEGYPGQCVAPCGDKKFWNGTNCADCDASCAQCKGPEPNQCLECLAGSVKQPLEAGVGGLCLVEDCGVGKFKIEEPSTCGNCDVSCATCRKEGEFGCLTCPASKVKVPAYKDALGKCMDNTCGAKQFINMNNNYACEDCQTQCGTCIGGSEKECLTCVAADQLYKFPVGSDDQTPGFCVHLNAADDYSCETHKIRNMDNGACEECPGSCAECEGISEMKCIKCYEGMIKVPAFEGKPGQCLEPCQSHFYRLSQIGECLECHTNCMECEGPNSTDCLSCPSELPVKQPPTKNVPGSCVQACESHKYFSLSTNICENCKDSCVECSGPTADDCLSCDAATTVKIPFGDENPGICVTGTCATNKYPSYNQTTFTLSCLDCNVECETCMGPEVHQCLSCAAGKSKMPIEANIPGKCYTPCADTHQFMDVFGDMTCKECFSNCATCIGPKHTDCLTCNTGFIKQYNAGDETKPSNCEIETWCPQHQYYDGTTCKECDESCKMCLGAGKDKCNACYEGMIKAPQNPFVGGYCVQECPIDPTNNGPQFRDPLDNYICKPCHSSCEACIGPTESDCVKCKDATKIKYPKLPGVKGICTESCTDGDKYYLTDATTAPITCAQCHADCAECIDNQQNSCLVCPPSYYKDPPEKERTGKCLPECTEATPSYRDAANVCQQCHDTCGSCLGEGEWKCMTCTGSKIKVPKNVDVPGKCFSPCPETHQFLNESDFTCQECHSSCATCVGGQKNQCLACAPELFKNPLDINNFDLSQPGLCETFFFCPQSNQYREIADSQCQTCHESCVECFGAGAENCRSCAATLGKYPFNPEEPGYCLQPCPLAFQFPDPAGTCKDCHESCDLCFGETDVDCLSCRNLNQVKYPMIEGAKGKCLEPCADGFFRNATDWTLCQACYYTCKTCTGAKQDQCLFCQENYTKINGTMNLPGICEIPCVNSSEYKDEFTQTCKPCHSTCEKCAGPESNQCLLCKPDFVPSDPSEYAMVSCLEKCTTATPTYRDIATKTCLNCHPSCASCFGPDDQQCLSCPEGVRREKDDPKQPSKCLPECHPGYFFTQTGTAWTCTKCISDCIECSGPSASECLKCPEDKDKIPKYGSGICVSKCEFANQYHDTANNNICKACHPDCAECSGPEANQCYKCSANAEGKIKWPPVEGEIGACIVNDCAEGKYKAADGTCQDCPANCKSCITNEPNKCIDCMNLYTKFPPKFGEPTECVTDPCLNSAAPNPGFINPQIQTECLACNSSCATCLFGGADGCLTCPAGFVKVPAGDGIPGVCSIACDQGFYRDFTNASYQICKPCFQNCLTCEGPGEGDCLTCQAGLFLNKLNAFQNSGTCDDFGYCPEGQYGDVATNTCKDCLQDACLFCVGGGISDCKKCADGFEKLPPNPEVKGECVVPCLDAYTFRDSTGACSPCHASCKTCSGLADIQCLMCKDTTLAKYPKQEGIPGKCLTPCAEHQYRYSVDEFADCHDCDNSCGNCKGPSPTECLSCPSGYIKVPFNPEVIGSCMASCSDVNQYRYNGTCLPCNSKCATCIGPNSYDCLTCPTNTQRLNPDIRYNTSCVTLCEVGKFWNIINSICDACHPRCKTCMGEKDNECLSCKDHVVNPPLAGTFGSCGKFEQGIWCEPHFYINSTDFMTCNACHANCSECKGPENNQCTKCYENFELFLPTAASNLGECIKICDAGFYRASAGECAPCDESCMECKGPGINECKSCSTVFIKMPPSLELLGRCVVPCADSATYRDIDGTCKACSDQCLKCSGPGDNECLSCTSPKILDQTKYGVPGHCITTTCTSTQFLNGSECVNCSSDCLTCVGPSIWECISCAADKVKYPAEIGVPAYCLTKCDDNYYRDISDWEFQECKPCHPSCLTCEGPDDWQCLICVEGLFFNGKLEFIGSLPGKCETFGYCPQGQYRVLDPKDQCIVCHESCLKCDGNTDADCLECPTYLIKYPPAIGTKGKCLEYCQPGFYRDTSTSDCVACHTSCAECVGSSEEDCLKCVQTAAGVMMVKYPQTEGIPGKCISEGTCAANQYADPSDSWACKDCHTDCVTCSGGANTECLSCISGYFKKPLDLGIPGSCIQMCPLNTQYKDVDGVCQNCDPTCLTCIGAGPSMCLTCNATHEKVPPALNEAGYCLNKCSSPHQYRSKKDFECYECHNACETCIGNTEYDCKTCYVGVDFFQFTNGTVQCYTWCKEHQYKEQTGECKECDMKCAECETLGPYSCWSCWEGYIKIPNDPTVVGACYEKCQEGLYRSADGYCKPCNESCKTCEGETANDCLSCANAAFVKVPATPNIKGFCMQNTCTAAQYIEATGGCQDCNETCATCVGGQDSECMTCAAGKVKFPFSLDQPAKCVDQCEIGFYRKNETVCGYCHSSCATCMNGTEKHCLTCTAPKELQADSSGIGACVEPCEDGFFRDIQSTYKECKPCYYSCGTCTGPDAQLCKTCATGYYFNPIDGTFGTCDTVGICPQHQFRDSTDNCVECDATCKECSIIATNCTACSYEFKLVEGKCLLPCDQALQPQTYRDATTNLCKACHSSCQTCVGPAETDCLECILATQTKQPNIVGVKGQCFDSCASNQYFDTVATNACANCHENCSSCIGGLETDCLTCPAGLIKKIADPKIPSACIPITCNSSQYLSPDGSCKPCSSKCLTCVGYSEYDCLSCASTMKLLIMDGDFKGQCTVPCSTGYFRKSDGTCSACHENCGNCSGPEPWNCLSCKTGLHKNPYEAVEGTCDEFGECPQMNQFRNSYDQCQNCHISCKECFGGNANECKICADNNKIKVPSSYELPGYCAFPCTEKQRYRKTDGTCAACHTSCLICSGPYDYQCEVCVDTTVTKYPQLIGYPGKCLTNCTNENQYYDSAQVCQDCSALCKACIGGGDKDCLSCVDGYYKLPTGEVPGGCYQNCAPKEYRDSYNNTCLGCHDACAECVGPTDYDCIACPSGFYKEYPEASFVGKCFEECTTTTQFRGYDGTCYDCFENCATCTGPSEEMCLTCSAGFYLNPPGTSIGRCESKAICFSDHQYRDPSDDLCKECNAECVTCFAAGTDQCKTCPAGKMKIPFSQEEPGSCLDKCPEGQYNSGSACANCAAECQTCTGGTANDCLICANHTKVKMPPAIDQPGFCADPCAEGQYAASATSCGDCHADCLSCTDSTAADCLVCAGNKIKFPAGIDKKGSCLTPCVDTTKYPTTDGDCKPCFEGCLTCAGPEQTDCLTCPSPLVKNTPIGEPGACVKGCSSTHQYPDADGVCQECDSTCLTCKGPGIYSCLTCASGQQKHPPSIDKLGLCSSCSLHQFLDTAGTGYCEECSYACTTCHGLQFNNCMSCNATLFRTLVTVSTATYPYEQECQCMNYYVQEADPADAALTICNLCHYSCMKCSTSATETACTECEVAKGRIIDVDTNKCICNEIGFFTIADQLQCGICFPTCKRCTNDSRYGCLECNGGIDVWADGSCGCPTGEYLNSAYLCVKPENCENNLVGIVSEANADNTGNICGPKPCPVPFFFNYTTNECKDKCYEGCLTCINGNETSCETCADNKYFTRYGGTTGKCSANCNTSYYYVPAAINPLNKSTCDDKCPQGYGPIENLTQKCGPCHSICEKCYKANDEFACTSCKETFSLSDSYGTQLINNKTMHKTTCQPCGSGQFLAVTPWINDATVTAATEKCITTCLKGQYEDKLNRKCINCKDTNCVKCSGKYDYCEQCLTDYDLIEGICQAEVNQESCINQGKFVKGVNLECVEECGVGYFSNMATHICEKCDQSCSSCSGGEDPNKCKSCSGTRIYYEKKHMCVYSCPTETYLTESSTGQKQCLECIIGCGTCTGPAIADCTKCTTSYFQVSIDDKLADCVQACNKFDPNTYGDATTQTCQKCNSKCATCANGLETGCLSCYGDDIFSRPSASVNYGNCKAKSESKTQLQSTTVSDISKSTADELQQQATEIVAAFTQSATTTTSTATSTSGDSTASTSSTTTGTQEYATDQSKEEIEQQAQKKAELIEAVITTAKEMSTKDLLPDQVKSLVTAMKSSVQPEVEVILVTSTGEKVKSTSVTNSNTSSTVVRKFEKDQAVAICDTLSNIAGKINIKDNKEVAEDMFAAASDLLKQTSALQQDKKMAKGEINSIEDGANSTAVKDDMEVVKKVVEFFGSLQKQIKNRLSNGESMSFNTTEAKISVAKYSTGDKNSLKTALMSSLTTTSTTSASSATGTTSTGTSADSTAATADATVYYDENGQITDDTNPNRTVNSPEIIINEGLVDHVNNVLDSLKAEGKNVDSLTIKQASYDIDINTLGKNTSEENSTNIISDFARASQLQQFAFELDDESKVNISGLSDDSQFEIKFDYIPETDASYSCVYWNETKQKYDTEGVELDPTTKKCKAKHLTDFIVQKKKKFDKNAFNYGILATVILIAICIVLFAVWFFQHKKNQVASFEGIGTSQEIQFSKISPLISILKAETLPEALNKTMHFACYLINVMMLLVLYFRDSIDLEKNFDKLLVTGVMFALSISIIIKYFLGAIKVLSQFNPWVYLVLAFAYFATCSGITIWRMNNLTNVESWNWFHAMYLSFIFDLLILDTLLIVAMKGGLGKTRSIQYLLRNGGFFAVPNSMTAIENEHMKAKANIILDLENQSKPSSHNSPDKRTFSNEVIVVDNIAEEGEQFGSRPESKAGILKN